MPTTPKPPPNSRRRGASSSSTAKTSKSQKGVLFTSKERREKIGGAINGLAGIAEARGDEVNAATGFILRQNADALAESYGTVADEHVWFARYVDQMLTGGVWGQFIAINLMVGVQIGLVRGWIDPAQLPAPLQSFFAVGFTPPPSDEVREAAEKAAKENGKPSDPPPSGARRTPRRAPSQKKADEPGS